MLALELPLFQAVTVEAPADNPWFAQLQIIAANANTDKPADFVDK